MPKRVKRNNRSRRMKAELCKKGRGGAVDQGCETDRNAMGERLLAEQKSTHIDTNGSGSWPRLGRQTAKTKVKLNSGNSIKVFANVSTR